MMETEDDISNASTIDNAVFEESDSLVDEWQNGQGKRLYKLADRIGDNPPIHALTEYEREVDPDTGETVETETVDRVGRLVPNIHLRSAEKQVLSRLEEENEPGHELWDEVTVETMLDMFERYLDNRVTTLLETDHHYKYEVVDLHLLKEVRISIDEEEEAAELAGRTPEFSEAEWSAFLWAVREETTYLDSLRGEDVDAHTDRAYAFIPGFESVPEWRLRAVENHICGVYKTSPALANVAALLDSDTVSTQAEIADELDKSESTISQQVADVEEWKQRTQWMCDNRLGGGSDA